MSFSLVTLNSVVFSFLLLAGCLCNADDPGAATKRICRVQGIAVCWSPEAVYYIPLNPAAPGVYKLVGTMLGNKRAHKVTYDLKAQMLALLAGTMPPNSCAI